MTTKAVNDRSLRSVPALAAALRQMGRGDQQFVFVPLPSPPKLSPMYRISSETMMLEAQSAARVVGDIAERMRRLRAAYGEWQEFDVAAYFDLPADFSNEAVRIVERVSTVHILVFADLLLPSFQDAARYWTTMVMPTYAHLDDLPEHYQRFIQEIQPTMLARWEQLLSVLRMTRDHLLEDIGFLTTSGAEDERMRWQSLWRIPPIAELNAALTPELTKIPTLTLALDFSLPAQRQPGRLRRLRRNRERHRARRRAQ